MTTPSRLPPGSIARKPVSASPFNPPDLPPLSAHVASEAAKPSSASSATPPPTPPAKDRPPETKNPLQSNQHGRPGTPDFFLQNSTYSMPGAYPTTPGALSRTRTNSSSPLAADPRTHNTEMDIPVALEPATPPPRKRRSSGNSIRTLLSSLRRPSSQSPRDPRVSGDSYSGTPSIRPDTPGRDSIASSNRPSLKKKMSGSFWGKRKSSLGMEIMMKKEDQDLNTSSTPDRRKYGIEPNATPDQSTSSPPADEASEGGSLLNSGRPRKSSTFWRRRTSMGNELDTEAPVTEKGKVSQGHARTTSSASGPNPADPLPQPLRKKKSGNFWPRKLSLSLQRETEAQQRVDGENGHLASPTSDTKATTMEEPEEMFEGEAYVPLEKPRSPPPKLPELNLEASEGHGGLLDGGAEDIFGNIGKD